MSDKVVPAWRVPEPAKKVEGQNGWTRLQNEPKRETLVQEAAKKPGGYFLQIDGDKLDDWDDVWAPDDEGYGVCGGSCYELRNTAIPVRVQIAEGTTKEDALALLERITNWLQRDYAGLIDSAQGRSEGLRQPHNPPDIFDDTTTSSEAIPPSVADTLKAWKERGGEFHRPIAPSIADTLKDIKQQLQDVGAAGVTLTDLRVNALAEVVESLAFAVERLAAKLS
jgi:hypothetical protein